MPINIIPGSLSVRLSVYWGIPVSFSSHLLRVVHGRDVKPAVLLAGGPEFGFVGFFCMKRLSCANSSSHRSFEALSSSRAEVSSGAGGRQQG